jgi:hypothetical protein
VKSCYRRPRVILRGCDRDVLAADFVGALRADFVDVLRRADFVGVLRCVDFVGVLRCVDFVGVLRCVDFVGVLRCVDDVDDVDAGFAVLAWPF